MGLLTHKTALVTLEMSDNWFRLGGPLPKASYGAPAVLAAMLPYPGLSPDAGWRGPSMPMTQCGQCNAPVLPGLATDHAEAHVEYEFGAVCKPYTNPLDVTYG